MSTPRNDYSESVCIVFPSDWPNEKEAHCTIIWLGNIPDLDFTKEDVESVLRRLNIPAPGKIRVMGTDLFGPNEDVTVAILDPARLADTRGRIERTLNKIGIENASEFKQYRPHVTYTEGAEIPEYVTLGKPILWWGDDYPEPDSE